MEKRKKSNRLDVGIREVSVRLPCTRKDQEVKTDFYWSEQGRRLLLGKKLLYVPCKANTEISELKRRIGGKLQLPPERIKLFYFGELLYDDDVIPLGSFESSADAESDEDIFKARIFLSIHYVLPKIEDEEGEEILVNKDTDGDGQEGKQDLYEEKEDEGEQSLIASFQHESSHYSEDFENNLEFDLVKEMEAINCDNFLTHLLCAGYDNAGAFGAMEEEDLRNGGLQIPRLARIRIITLAGAIQRRHAVFEKDGSRSTYKDIEKGLLGSSVVKALTIEGDDKVYTTKADLQRAWKKKVNDEEALKEGIKRSKSAKIHPHDVQAMIDRLRANCLVDEDGIKLMYSDIGMSKIFCCTKHEHEALHIRERFIEMRKQFNVAYLESVLRRIDVNKDGYIPRKLLEVLLRDSLHKSLHQPVSELKLSKLLDTCLMTSDEQLARQDWAGQCERTYNLGRIPIPIYHTRRFVRLATALLAESDNAKFIECAL